MIITLGWFSCTHSTKKTHCNSIDTKKFQNASSDNNIVYNIPYKISKLKTYYFSNTKVKDNFILTITPGQIKQSKSTFKIQTSTGMVLFSQTFSTYFFIQNLFPSDLMPNRKEIDKEYNKNIQKFLDSFIQSIDSSDFREFSKFGNITKPELLSEIKNDTSIRMFDIPCFDCDEGGSVIFYSHKDNKVDTIIDHD